MNLKKVGKVFTSKFVGSGPSSYKKEFTGPRSHKVEKHWPKVQMLRFYVTHLFLSNCNCHRRGNQSQNSICGTSDHETNTMTLS